MGKQIQISNFSSEQAAKIYDAAHSLGLYFKARVHAEGMKIRELNRQEFIEIAPGWKCDIFLRGYDKANGDIWASHIPNQGRIWYATVETGTIHPASPEFVEAMQQFIKSFRKIVGRPKRRPNRP